MKLKRQLAAVGGALALVAGGTSVALIGGMSTSSAAEVPSSAFGLQSTGLIPIDKTPTVTSTDGKLVTDSLVSLPSNPLLSGGVINVQAQNDSAEADVASLDVGGGLLSQIPGLSTQLAPVCSALKQVSLTQLQGAVNQVGGLIDTGALGTLLNQVSGGTGIDLSAVTAIDLSNLLPADLSGLCDALSGKTGLLHVGAVTTECHGTNGNYTGSLSVADPTVLGLPINIDTSKPNSKVEVPGVATITVRRETSNPNGSFTVDGLVINLLGQVEITLTSATCGHITQRVTPTTNAPSPTPVHTRAPVTG
ncbi:choice-of-anchor P family protein [Nocardioides montaniterrae]